MTVDKFIEEQILRHRRPNTIRNDKSVLSRVDTFKGLDSCTADDLKAYILQYKKEFKEEHGREPQESTLNDIYATLKKYYTFMGKPDCVDWIKTKQVLKKINPNKLLTPAEIHNMLRVCDNSRDKAMLAIAYESGMRLGELLSLRVEDVKINDGECKVRIPENYEGEDITSKTGTRSLILIESLPYIEKHLTVHNGDKNLFDIKAVRAHQIIKEMAEKAGIEKNVYWHLLRHTRATEMARLGMQETAMKKRFGWAEDSSMIKRYTSLTDEDADNSYREALGLGIKKKDIAINPIARRCSKCGKLVDTGEYCPQCAEIQKLTEANTKAQFEIEAMKAENENMKAMFNKDAIKALIEARVKEIINNK